MASLAELDMQASLREKDESSEGSRQFLKIVPQ